MLRVINWELNFLECCEVGEAPIPASYALITRTLCSTFCNLAPFSCLAQKRRLQSSYKAADVFVGFSDATW